MNAANDSDFKKTNLLQSTRELLLGKRFIFQRDDDNNPPKYKLILFRLCNSRTPTLQSPDLNPIKKLWLDLEKMLLTHGPYAT